MKYARIINNVVIETFVPQAGFTIEESFTAEVVAMFEVIPEEVDVGWGKHADGTFISPNPE